MANNMVHVLVVNLIRDSVFSLDDLSMYDKAQNYKKEVIETKLTDLFRYCFLFLRYFVQDNPINQKLLEDKIISLNSSMATKDLGQIEFFCELFRNNKSICLNQFDEISDDFVRLIKLKGRKAKYLNFFIVVQRVGDEFLNENQKKVLNLLIDNSN